MPRFKPDPIVRDEDNWDPDETAVMKGSFGYLELQRIGLAMAAINDVPATEEGALASGQAFARVIVQCYRSITLRRPETPYHEGMERPKFEFTEEDLLLQPMETLSFLLTKGMNHIASFMPKKADETGIITEAAKEAGLTVVNFPANGADKGVLLAR